MKNKRYGRSAGEQHLFAYGQFGHVVRPTLSQYKIAQHFGVCPEVHAVGIGAEALRYVPSYGGMTAGQQVVFAFVRGDVDAVPRLQSEQSRDMRCNGYAPIALKDDVGTTCMFQ